MILHDLVKLLRLLLDPVAETLQLFVECLLLEPVGLSDRNRNCLELTLRFLGSQVFSQLKTLKAHKMWRKLLLVQVCL